jgi:diacylglycerol kinase
MTQPERPETNAGTSSTSTRGGDSPPGASLRLDRPSPRLLPVPTSADADRSLADWPEPEPSWAARAGRRNLRDKLVAGLRGWKHAVRGDSSFFAHGYRALLTALVASMLGIGPMAWCLLVLGFGLILVAEMAHSAVDTLARALGDPEEPGLRTAREIATGGVLASVIVSAAVTVTVIAFKLNDLLGWW